MKNLELAKIFYNLADLLELQNVPFKPQAYRKAAREIESLTEDIAEIHQQGKLQDLPGIGKNIAEKIAEYLTTGKIKSYEQLKKQTKIDVEQLNLIPGLGPKRIKLLYDKLKIKNIKDLERAIQQKKLQQLAGFGAETEKTFTKGIEFVKTKPQRFLYLQLLPLVNEITARFQQSHVKRFEIAGSFRRRQETIGDLDFLAVSDQPEKVMKTFVSLPDVKEIISQGPTRSSIRLSNGLQIDLRVVKEKEWGSALMYFIGNKDHNIELRKLALSQGYTLSEYGLFKLKNKQWLAGRTESEVYTKLGLDYIEPELRQNQGEIAAAQKHHLPKLLELKNINGLFHNHSNWSDGTASLLEMAQTAERLGLKFISFNDHYSTMGIVNSLTEKRLDAYLKEIEKVRKKVKIRVFSGVEIDILKDGTLPLPVKQLKRLDVVIGAIHSATKMSEAEMTARIVTALENYPINILAHPTGRLLNKREAYAVNLEKVFQVAKKRNVFLEINSLPERMDLSGENVKAAIKEGCKIAIDTDAHDPEQLKNYFLGVNMARRGWAEQKDVLNCWSLPQIEKALRK